MKQLTLTVLLMMLGLGLRAQSLQLASPNGGEVWLGGSVKTISWTYSNVDNIKIEYSLNNGLNWTIITASYPSSALSYTWTVPCIGSNQAKVRITNTLQFTQDESSTVFTIPEPTVDITYPNGGESFGIGTGQYIEWATTGVTTVKVQYSVNNGSAWTDIGDFPAINNYCNWIAPAGLSSQARIRAFNIESTRNRDSSATLFNIVGMPTINADKYKGGALDGYNMCSNLPDTIRVITPNGGEVYSPTNTVTLNWSYRHIDQIKIEYSTDNGSSWNLIVNDIPASQLNYTWTVPNTPSNQCRLKITSLRTGFSDISDAPFTINAAFVNVLYPNGGESFGTGTGQYIEWDFNSVATVKLEYSTDNGSTWTTIGTAPAVNKYANWIPPATVTSACLIRISDNALPSVSDVSNATFSLFNLPTLDVNKYKGGLNDGYSMNSNILDSIRVTSPNGGELWTAASTRTITWAYNEVDNVAIEFTLDDGLTWSTLAASVPASQLSYSWTIPTTPSYTCRIRVRDIARPIQDVSDAVFIIPTSYVQITYPNGGESFGTGTGQYIEWEYSDLATIKLEYSINNGSTWSVIGTAPAANKYANWIVPANPSAQILIRATDIANPIYTDNSNTVFSSFNLPTLDLNKYKGGQFDGYSMYAFKDVYVKVIKPNGGEIWGNGTTQQVRWATLNTTENLKVEYSIDNESTWTTLLNDVPNLPVTFNWNIASPVSTICKVRATTMSGIEFDKSDDFFTIANPNGIITNPIVGNSFCSGENTTVTFNRSVDFNPGNRFIVQLSDSVGTFNGSLINIGEITATEVAPITVTLPPRFYTSNLYRLRVIGTNPPTLGTDNGTNITIRPLPAIRLGRDTSICAGSTIALNATSSGSNYLWSNGATTSSIQVSQAGQYWVAATNSCGTTRDTINVNVIQSPSVNLGPDRQICLNSSTVLVADSGAYNYQWSTGAVSRSINAVLPGTYTVSVSNACGIATDNIVITNIPAATLNLGQDRGLCSGESVVLNAGNAGATYLWSNGSNAQTITVTTPGSYSVNVTTGCGIVSDQITFYNGAFQVNAGADLTICAGQRAQLSATGGNTYTWNTGQTTSSISVTPTANTSYTVSATNIYNCISSDVVVVNVNTPITPTFSAIAPICQGSTPPVLPTSSTNIPAITGTWNATVSSASVGTTVYTFTPNAGQCATIATLAITINSQQTQPPTACYQTATFNAQTCSWEVTGTQPAQPPTACYQTATFNDQTCSWMLAGTQPAQPATACYQTATFNNQTCSWVLTGTQPAQPATACYQTATFNSQTCSWDVTGTQPVQPATACYQTATFNNQSCAWVLTGTQPAQPSTACYQTATFNNQSCAWVLTGTQPAQPSTACYQTATFNNQSCAWVLTGTQPTQPATACYETASFNTASCSWVVTGSPTPAIVTNASACESYTWEANGQTYSASGNYSFSSNCQDYTLNLTIAQQPPQPPTACYQTATFNSQTCSWDVTGTQPVLPPTACYQTATFNSQTCSWDVTGTQPVQPATACYQTATFNNQTCSWVLTGTQPAQPATACYQTATFNNQSCAWVLTGTQPTQPATACYETATFNTASCSWVVTGSPAPAIVTNATACESYTWEANGQTYTSSGNYSFSSNCLDYTLNLTIAPQPPQPPTACYQTATFNAQTCSWDVTGTQPAQPSTACYQTATFNTQSCSWDVTGTQPVQPATACYQTATFNTQSCSWDITGTQPVQPATACYQTATFNAQTCSWVLTGTQPAQPATACYQTATFNAQTCSWVLTGTQPAQPATACYQTATFNTQSCSWDVTGTQPVHPATACYETATFNTQSCSWDVTGSQPVQPATACYETATFNTASCSWDVAGSPAPAIVTTASACGSYTWSVNGQSYTTSGSYTYSENCQEYALNLTINQATTSTINATINQGESYSFNGQTLSTAGTYTATLQNASGCDLYVTLILTVNPITSAGCYAATVVDFVQGLNSTGGAVPAIRSNATQALGQPEAVVTNVVNFVSLGFGGTITVAFQTPIANGAGNDILLNEATWGNYPCSRYPEKADVFASQDGTNFIYLGKACQDASFDLGTLSWAKYIRLVDVSDALSFNTDADGYDLNGIECLNGSATNPTNDGLQACTLQEIVSYSPGTRKNGTAVPSPRNNANNALGEPQSNNTVNFVSLGFGGTLVAKFDYVVFNQPGNDLRVTETSFGNPGCTNYPEKARVSLSLDNLNWVEVGEICQDGTIEMGAMPYAQFIRIQDASPMSSSNFNKSADGYDVDAVVVLNNGCGAAAARLADADNTTTPNEDLGISVFPNPMEEFTIVKFEGLESHSDFNFQIMDAAGRLVRNQNIRVSPEDPTYQFNASELARGIYLVVVSNDNANQIIRLVK